MREVELCLLNDCDINLECNFCSTCGDSVLVKIYRVVQEDYDEHTPEDTSYGYNSVRL